MKGKKKNWVMCRCEDECKNLDCAVIKCRVPDFKMMDKGEFMVEYHLLAPPVLLEKIWKFGNEQYSSGFSQGQYDPEFINE